MRRLRPLTEEECYARCYGGGDEAVRVRVVRVEAKARPRLRFPTHLSGEELRRLFEERLERREANAA